MARLLMAGFEGGNYYPFSGSGASLTCPAFAGARTGDYHARCGSWSTSNMLIAALPTTITEGYFRIGVRPYGTAANFRSVISFYDEVGTQVLTLAPTAAGEYNLGVYAGAAIAANLKATYAGFYAYNVWCCLECYFLLDPVAGRVIIKRDGVVVIDYTGALPGSGISAISPMHAQTLSGQVDYDDIALNDTTGGINNTWVGRGGIYGLVPVGPGANTDLTPLLAPNWSQVNEIPSGGDVSYVQSATLGDKDTYEMGDLPSPDGVVSAVALNIQLRAPTAGDANVKPVLRQDGVDYSGTSKGFDVSYVGVGQIYDNAPDGTVWSVAKVNAIEAGVEVD